MKDKTSMYILSIIGIVAIVGVLSLLISSGSSSNIIGQAIRTNVTCGDGICQPSFENRSNCPADCTGKKSTGIDTDSDGTLDVRDTDDDNDGYSDADEITAGTDSLDASSVPLPDLTHDEDSTSFSVTGTGYVTATGEVVKSDLSLTATCGLRNDGIATARGSRSPDTSIYNMCRLYDESGDSGYIIPLIGITSTIAPSGIYTWSKNWTEYSSSSDAIDILQEIYEGSGDVYIQYDIDYATTSYVTESDETNNEGGIYIALDSSMYSLNWVEVECQSDSDCASGCGCSTDYSCYQTTSSGGSTYLTTTAC